MYQNTRAAIAVGLFLAFFASTSSAQQTPLKIGVR